jgi:putative alpha-1,2-mannosidase
VYAGRHDRTAEVVRTVLKYHYATGEGGLPGNDDSGGLSSWYVWNGLGLFPVAGQDLYLIGSPIFESATLSLPGGPFQIQVQGGSDENIYVQSASLNGEPLDRAWLRVGEVAAGGALLLRMGPQPSAWGRKNLPG